MADGHTADGEGLGKQRIGDLGIRPDGGNGLRQILQHKAHGNGGDEAGQVVAGFPDRPVGQQFHQHSHTGADENGRHHGQPAGNPRRHHDGNNEKQRVAAHHNEIAVGKVNELDDPVDHGIAQSDQGVYAAEAQPGNQELNECDHWKIPSWKRMKEYTLHRHGTGMVR